MSRLEDMSVGFRNTNISKNEYNDKNQYTAGHPDALSTGDEQGKGEVNGQIGSATDIKTRERLLIKNKFKNGEEYNAGTA